MRLKLPTIGDTVYINDSPRCDNPITMQGKVIRYGHGPSYFIQLSEDGEEVRMILATGESYGGMFKIGVYPASIVFLYNKGIVRAGDVSS